MKQQFKPYLISAVGFMLVAYLLALLFLALLTTINHAAGYPLYNFLGSNVDLQPAILQLLPAQNPYHLQKWVSLPIMTLILSLIFLVLTVMITLHFARQIYNQGSGRLLLFFIFMLGLAFLAFNQVYGSIGSFMAALLQA